MEGRIGELAILLCVAYLEYLCEDVNLFYYDKLLDSSEYHEWRSYTLVNLAVLARY